MRSPRLLPVVIAATGALLLLKSVGLVTGGGYMLVGTTAATAAGASGGHGGGAAVSADGPTMDLPLDTTLEDAAPTLADDAVTLPLGQQSADSGHGGAAAHGAADSAESDHGDAAAEQHADPAEDHAATEDHAAEGEHADPAASAMAGLDCAPMDSAPAAAGDGHGGAAAEPAPSAADCLPVDANGDAIPLVKNSAGQLVPLSEADPAGDNELLLLQRLGERRTQLDAREDEIDMRLALIEAAERQLAERKAALEALEARVGVLVDQGKEEEKQQFASVVAMYETMKPREAAAIFDQLDMPVLLRVVRSMNPRKMAPVLAQMDPARARDLTIAMAAQVPEQSLTMTPDDLASLPQIVGQ